MAVDIEFYKTDLTPISLDKDTGGVNLGIIKKNQQQIVPVIIKNLGTNDANNVYVIGSPLHSSSEISALDYEDETNASRWKSFSMLPDGVFNSNLILPNIKAGATMLGVKKYSENFANPASSLWTNDVLAGHTFSWTGNSVKVTSASGIGSYYARMSADGWGNNKEIDFTVQFIQPATLVAGAAFTMFCLRQNCLGDEKGYLITLKRTSTIVNGGTCFFEMRKAAGIKANGTTDFGTVLNATTAVPWHDFINIRFKLFTNTNGLPEVKIWVDNILNTDTPCSWGVLGMSWIDTSNTYPYAGKVTAIFGSGGASIVGSDYYEMRSAILLTDDINGKVYIKTLVGDGAEDSITYNSAMELFYDLV